MKKAVMSLMGAVVICVAGCGSTYYQPNALPVGGIKAFSAKGSIALVNGQPSRDTVPFSSTLHANLNAWTDVAVGMTENELLQRGLTVSKEAAKSLTISITSAKTTIPFMRVSSQIEMYVRTSSGYTATYTGKEVSAFTGDPMRQMDAALANVVAELLNDPEIVSFLSDGKAGADVPKQDSAMQKPDDIYTELRKLKGLLDDGIITQDEFDTRKKRILGN